MVTRMRPADHPRSRGVYPGAIDSQPSTPGSSPLARGLPVVAFLQAVDQRIIPARAGFTPRPSSRGQPLGDHPRSRGVYYIHSSYYGDEPGSSPLARGLQPPATIVVGGSRIIPARAGFTLGDPWNPNDEPHYQTAFTFTADLAPAPQSSDSAAVAQRSTRPPSEA